MVSPSDVVGSRSKGSLPMTVVVARRSGSRSARAILVRLGRVTVGSAGIGLLDGGCTFISRSAQCREFAFEAQQPHTARTCGAAKSKDRNDALPCRPGRGTSDEMRPRPSRHAKKVIRSCLPRTTYVHAVLLIQIVAGTAWSLQVRQTAARKTKSDAASARQLPCEVVHLV